MQPVRNKVAQIDEDGVLGLKLEEIEGHLFLHLDLDTITPSLIKAIREQLDRLLEVLQSRGHDIVFLTSPFKKSVKLWELIKPCSELMELEDGSWLGAWITFKE